MGWSWDAVGLAVLALWQMGQRALHRHALEALGDVRGELLVGKRGEQIGPMEECLLAIDSTRAPIGASESDKKARNRGRRSRGRCDSHARTTRAARAPGCNHGRPASARLSV